MKLTFVVLALFLAIPVLADGVLPCVPETATNYMVSGFTCTEGNLPDQFTVKNVSWDGHFGTVKVTPDQVLLSPATSPGEFGLDFSGAGGSNPFSISGAQTIKAQFAYTLDPRPPILNGIGLSVSSSGGAASIRPGAFGPVSPIPFAKLTALICPGDTWADGCLHPAEPFIVLHVDTSTGTLFDNADFKEPVSTVGVIVGLDMEAKGSSTIFSIAGAGTTVSSVPEPGPADLACCGLAALLALGYCRLRA
jgi:hypothetical protein